MVYIMREPSTLRVQDLQQTTTKPYLDEQSFENLRTLEPVVPMFLESFKENSNTKEAIINPFTSEVYAPQHGNGYVDVVKQLRKNAQDDVSRAAYVGFFESTYNQESWLALGATFAKQHLITQDLGLGDLEHIVCGKETSLDNVARITCTQKEQEPLLVRLYEGGCSLTDEAAHGFLETLHMLASKENFTFEDEVVPARSGGLSLLPNDQ